MPSALKSPFVARHANAGLLRRRRIGRHVQTLQALAGSEIRAVGPRGVLPEIGLADTAAVGRPVGVADRRVVQRHGAVAHERGLAGRVGADHLRIDDVVGREDRENREIRVHAVHAEIVGGKDLVRRSLAVPPPPLPPESPPSDPASPAPPDDPPPQPASTSIVATQSAALLNKGWFGMWPRFRRTWSVPVRRRRGGISTVIIRPANDTHWHVRIEGQLQAARRSGRSRDNSLLRPIRCLSPSLERQKRARGKAPDRPLVSRRLSERNRH